jgi:hypothetical protein
VLNALILIIALAVEIRPAKLVKKDSTNKTESVIYAQTY